MIVMYIQFVRSQNAVVDAMDKLVFQHEETVELNHTIEGITTIIQGRFKNNMQSGKTILFEHDGINFIVVPISDSKVIMSISMMDEEIEKHNSSI
jgi:hypothetical protein